MKKRIFGLILAVVMMLSCFTGCTLVEDVLSPVVGEEMVASQETLLVVLAA